MPATTPIWQLPYPIGTDRFDPTKAFRDFATRGETVLAGLPRTFPDMVIDHVAERVLARTSDWQPLVDTWQTGFAGNASYRLVTGGRVVLGGSVWRTDGGEIGDSTMLGTLAQGARPQPETRLLAVGEPNAAAAGRTAISITLKNDGELRVSTFTGAPLPSYTKLYLAGCTYDTPEAGIPKLPQPTDFCYRTVISGDRSKLVFMPSPNADPSQGNQEWRNGGPTGRRVGHSIEVTCTKAGRTRDALRSDLWWNDEGKLEQHITACGDWTATVVAKGDGINYRDSDPVVFVEDVEDPSRTECP